MRNYLYRKLGQAVTLLMAMMMISAGLAAQFRAPQPERKTARAVGVLETFANGSRRLVPVTFFYERRYYDATFYRATPVPFTLTAETVYEVQQYGKPLGTFTLLGAGQNLKQDVGQSASLWFATGRFKVAPDPALLAKKAAVHKVVLEDSSRPVLHRRAGSEGDNPVAHRAPTGEKTAEEDDDPERPKLHRKEGSGGDAQASAGEASSGQASGQEDADRPKLHRRDDAGSTAKAGAPGAMGSTSGVENTLAAAKQELTPSDDPEHPLLRRGKPLKEQSGPDLPEFSGKARGGGGVAGGGRREEAVTRQVAVSDAGRSETQELIYVCHEEERKQLEASVRELAQAELRRLAAQRGLVLPAGAKAAPVKAAAGAGSAAKASMANNAANNASKNAAKKTAAGGTDQGAKLPGLKAEEEQFVAYDFEYNNYATVVYSARYEPETAATDNAPAAKAATSASNATAEASASNASATGKSWVVTVIAREDEGKLVKLYSAVSDPRELDLYPEVRLVDAVDPEGYGRYGLLFREQKRDGVSWLLGRTTGYELQPVFETAVR
jgi:hypothetical protein